MQAHRLEHLWKRSIDPACRDPAPRLLRFLTAPLSLVYRSLSWLKRSWFWSLPGMQTEVPAFVISVGNLSVGGTGKTPLTLAVAKVLSELTAELSILNRGYGVRAPEWVQKVGQAGEPLVPFEARGDEASLLLRGAPFAKVWVSKRRALGAKAAVADGAEVLLLDDALQYWRLKRDLDLVALNWPNPFGNGRIFPRGPLREPPEALARAQGIFLKAEQAPAPEELAQLRHLNPRAPLFWMRRRLVGLEPAASDGAGGSPPEIARIEAAASGIAHPEDFFRTLETAGARLSTRFAYPDHHRFTVDELASWPRPVAITAKDRENLPEGADLSGVYVLTTEVEAVPLLGGISLGDLLEQGFEKALAAKGLTRRRTSRTRG